MQIPHTFYGINKDVKRRVRSLVKKVAKGVNVSTNPIRKNGNLKRSIKKP